MWLSWNRCRGVWRWSQQASQASIAWLRGRWNFHNRGPMLSTGPMDTPWKCPRNGGGWYQQVWNSETEVGCLCNISRPHIEQRVQVRPRVAICVENAVNGKGEGHMWHVARTEGQARQPTIKPVMRSPINHPRSRGCCQQVSVYDRHMMSSDPSKVLERATEISDHLDVRSANVRGMGGRLLVRVWLPPLLGSCLTSRWRWLRRHRRVAFRMRQRWSVSGGAQTGTTAARDEW